MVLVNPNEDENLAASPLDEAFEGGEGMDPEVTKEFRKSLDALQMELVRQDITLGVETFMTRAGQLKEIGIEAAYEREDWLVSEFQELMDALAIGDQAEVDDALVDIAWIAIGWLFKRRGLTVSKQIIREIGRANIDKVDPIERMVLYPNSTKVGKFEGWVGPDVKGILERNGLVVSTAPLDSVADFEGAMEDTPPNETFEDETPQETPEEPEPEHTGPVLGDGSGSVHPDDGSTGDYYETMNTETNGG